MAHVISLDFFWSIAATITSLVGNSHLEACFHKWVDLVTPQVPALRPTVKQNEQRSGTLNNRPQTNPVRLDSTKIAFFHVKTFCISGKSLTKNLIFLPQGPPPA